MLLLLHSGAYGTTANSQKYLDRISKESFDYLEVDIRISKDGILILSHDDNINGLKIENATFNTLKKMNSTILNFEDLMAFNSEHHFNFNFDLKCGKAAFELVKKMNDYNLIPSSIITGCNKNVIKDINAINNDAKVFYNLEKKDMDNPEEILKDLKSLNIYGINTDIALINNNGFKEIEKSNYKIIVWTLDTDDNFSLLNGKRIDGVTTNFPSLFRKYFNN